MTDPDYRHAINEALTRPVPTEHIAGLPTDPTDQIVALWRVQHDTTRLLDTDTITAALTEGRHAATKIHNQDE